MRIDTFFDGSFYKAQKLGIIAIYIKDTDSNEIIAKRAKLVQCKSSVDAEFKALLKLLKHLNNKQIQNLIPTDAIINICGDNLSVISYANAESGNKGIDKQDASDFISSLEILKSNNQVSIMWVKRSSNCAHEAVVNFKLQLKDEKHKPTIKK